MRSPHGVAQCGNSTCCLNDALMVASGDNGGVEVSPPPYPLMLKVREKNR